jgi:hypothetical protein
MISAQKSYRTVLWLCALLGPANANAATSSASPEPILNRYRLALNGLGCDSLVTILKPDFRLFTGDDKPVVGIDAARNRCAEVGQQITFFRDQNVSVTDESGLETGRYETHKISSDSPTESGVYKLLFEKVADHYVVIEERRVPEKNFALPQGPPQFAWFAAPIIQGTTTGVVALIGVVLTALFARRSWRLSHFTQKWFETVDFLRDHPEYIDSKKNCDYKNAFKDNEALQYEMVARRCIAFLDDMFYLGYKKELNNWYRGTISLFAGRHATWLKDNRDSYGTSFYAFIEAKLHEDRCRKTE